jgi:hypothetical protein
MPYQVQMLLITVKCEDYWTGKDWEESGLKYLHTYLFYDTKSIENII